jgi:ketosteroid isomerase-like protein
VSANLDLVRSIYADWERGDYSHAGKWAHPEIEYLNADGPAPGTWTGAHGMAAGFRDWVNAWHGYYTEADEYRELDDERVLVLNHSGGRGRASGLDLGEMRAKGATLFHVRDGEVIRLVAYWDRDLALADLGLAGEGGST